MINNLFYFIQINLNILNKYVKLIMVVCCFSCQYFGGFQVQTPALQTDQEVVDYCVNYLRDHLHAHHFIELAHKLENLSYHIHSELPQDGVVYICSHT